MKRGIYITANDRVIDQAIALMNSIRLYDPDSPVILIPYDNNYQQIADLLSEKYGVILYPDCLLYTSPSPRDRQKSRMPSSA